jgi:hypothetical protein
MPIKISPLRTTKRVINFGGDRRLKAIGHEVTPMVWDMMVAAAFVVVSVAVLVCFGFKFILTWSKKPPEVAPHPQHRRLASSLRTRATEPLKLPKIRGKGGKVA